MKTITIDISDRNSVDKAIAELKSVKSEWIRKANLCCETIAAMLADKIEENLSQVPFSDDLIDVGSHQATPGIPIYGVEARGNTVFVEDKEIAFIEFGAGVYYNGDGVENPLSSQVSFSTAIGSFGNGNGNKPYWFVAHNLISRGTPAYAPIYKAIMEITPQVPTIVRQVFV